MRPPMDLPNRPWCYDSMDSPKANSDDDDDDDDDDDAPPWKRFFKQAHILAKHSSDFH